MKNHPLFPPKDEGGESPDIVKILVMRHEGGAMVTAPRTFPAEELQSAEQLFELFGGGRYELVGRDEKTIKRRVPIQLPGRPRPLDGSPPEPERQQAAPVAVAAPPGQDPGLIQMLMQMSQNQTQFLVAMMKDSDARSREFLTMMQGQTQAHAQQMTALMGALIETRAAPPAAGGGGFRETVGAVFDIMAKGAEFAAGASGGAGPEAAADLLNPEKIGEFITVLERAKNLADKDGPIKPGEVPATEAREVDTRHSTDPTRQGPK